MKRRALLIGNSNGLAGVKLDIAKFDSFLKSDLGGQWFGSEITIKMNPSKLELFATIQNIKQERPDYAFVYYSGHGAYSKGTILEINAQEEYINENDLKYIATRQISIFDCCRNVITTPLTEKRALGGTLNLSESNKNIRPTYDMRIMQAIEQQVSLYACSINESALDTEDGGMYSKNLLSSVQPEMGHSFKLVSLAHEEAAIKTKNMAWVKELHRQNPTETSPKCFSVQQLVISINPNIRY
jgi:hypothetical protein